MLDYLKVLYQLLGLELVVVVVGSVYKARFHSTLGGRQGRLLPILQIRRLRSEGVI